MNFPEGARGTWNMLSYRKGRKPFKRPLEPSWKSTHWSKNSDVRTKSQRTETYPDIVKCYQNSQNKDHFHRTLEKQLTISETNKIKGKNQTFILPLPQHNQIVVGRRFPLTKENKNAQLCASEAVDLEIYTFANIQIKKDARRQRLRLVKFAFKLN